jgi:hypothetical protein
VGFLGSIGSFLGTAAKAVATGGLSVVAPKLIPKPINTALNVLTAAQFPTSLKAVAGTALAVATKNPAFLLPSGIQSNTAPIQGVQPMALNIGGILGSIGGIFGGNQNPLFQGISNVATIASQFVPATGRPLGAPSTTSGIQTLSAAGPALRSVATVGRSFFNKFPNLATAIQGYRNMGKKVNRAKLYALLKRFGPEIIVSGGILTAAAVNELMIAGPGRRRMNPANVAALRRSVRRLESFHHLCQRVDKLRRPRSRAKAGRQSSQQFVRQG